MLSERKTELIEKTYWTCRKPEHRHRTQQVAEDCIASTDPARNENYYMAMAHRNLDMVQARLQGKKFREIADAAGVSIERARQILAQNMRRARHQTPNLREDPKRGKYYFTYDQLEAGEKRRFVSSASGSCHRVMWRPGLALELRNLACKDANRAGNYCPIHGDDGCHD